MNEKNFLTEDDVRNLPRNQQNVYNSFLERIRREGTLYETELDEFIAILNEQYRTGVLNVGSGRINRFYEVLAENINSIINAITQVRNDAINEKRVFDAYQFKQIYEGLEVLQKKVKGRCEFVSSGILGVPALKSTLSRIEQLKNQVFQDISFYQSYNETKQTAIRNYRLKKESYDSLSLFGKFAARVNGQKKALQEARQQMINYESTSLLHGSEQPGEIFNPYPYDKYLEIQQLDQSTEGKSR